MVAEIQGVFREWMFCSVLLSIPRVTRDPVEEGSHPEQIGWQVAALWMFDPSRY